MTSNVLAVTVLGFVGVGIRSPTAELGLKMTEALPNYEAAPWFLGLRYFCWGALSCSCRRWGATSWLRPLEAPMLDALLQVKDLAVHARQLAKR